ncbi:hypothetical protein PUN28_014124 [Cardiocondyla obscurior]|uniref:Uncharacterized protein n=1 Tax=Cardiocondyla obscurior TaxID=286306 RepID=A0AAW2F1S7_9HYME
MENAESGTRTSRPEEERPGVRPGSDDDRCLDGKNTHNCAIRQKSPEAFKTNTSSNNTTLRVLLHSRYQLTPIDNI